MHYQDTISLSISSVTAISDSVIFFQQARGEKPPVPKTPPPPLTPPPEKKLQPKFEAKISFRVR